MATVDEKRDLIRDRMERRAEERFVLLEQRRADRALHGHKSELESAPLFMEALTSDVEAVRSRLALEPLRKLGAEDQNTVFQEVAEEIVQLNRRLTASTMFLPAFDVEQSREMIQQCQHHLAEARQLLQPKKKFAFGKGKPKAAKKAAPRSPTSNDAPGPVAPKARPTAAQLGDYGLLRRSDEPEELMLQDCGGKDLFLSELTNCRVRVSAGGKAMRMDRLKGCVVVCGPAAGSIFIEDCEDCTFVVACQQLRVHSTHRTNFYIHVTSKAIIEFCSDLSFAPYPASLGEPDSQGLAGQGLRPDVNNWDQVEDFCHLALDVPSPNWRVLPEAERQRFELL